MLDRLRSKRRLRIGRTFHLTEFGYQTSPPDPAAGIALTLQTRYLQQAAYIAWKYKRVSGLSYYQWDDEPVVNRGSGTKRYSGWQTGLRFNNGRRSRCSRRCPRRSSSTCRAGARPGCCGARSARTPSREVEVADPPARRGRLPPLTTVERAADGIWTFRTSVTTGAQYRYRWTPQPTLYDPNPLPRESGIVDLGRRESSPYKASLAQ